MDGYSIINLRYYDPNNSLFKSGRNDREYIKTYWCNNSENCEAYKRKKCVMLNGLWGESCPYGKIRQENGYTKAARNCGKLIRDAKSKYGFCEYALKELKFLCKVGDYVFLNLPHLDNYVNPFPGIVNKYFLPAELFTAEKVVELIKYVPRALFERSPITAYQREYVPVFCNQLKRYMPDMYEKVKAIYPEIESRIEKIDYKGKQAKVFTLLPGIVKVGSNQFEWNGEYLSGKASNILFSGMKDGEEMRIIPHKDTCVEIADNATVTEETEFRDE